MKRVLLLMLVSFIGCAQSKSKSITEFSQNDIKNAVLVDVRTPAEYLTGHIDNARNINWYDADFEKQIVAIDKEETIYLYCKKGGRSAKAAHLLDSLGYKNIVDLEGGYDTYLKK